MADSSSQRRAVDHTDNELLRRAREYLDRGEHSLAILAWQARLGVARLDGQPGFADTDVWKLGANAKWTFNPGAPLRVFVDGGPHLYHFDPGSVEGGANLGLGLGVPAGARFSFELTWDYHWALTASPSLEFSELQLGTLVSF